MSKAVTSTYQYVWSWLTNKSPEDVAVEREALAARVASYTAKFDASLNEKWDPIKDAVKINERIQGAQEMTNAYYDIATDFYEYGWGQSFHFASRFEGESFEASLARHEHFLALKLGLKAGQTVLDVGCGVGGPLRCIARFSGAKVVGLNNNAYQVKRAKRLNQAAGLQSITDVVQGDFMKMPFESSTFDHAYAIEATCHAPDRTGCFKQVFNSLKEGGIFAGYEWCMTDQYDANNALHNQIKHGIEIGNSLPTLTHYSDVIEHLKKAGFEVIEHFDLALVPTNGVIPWYSSFLGGFTISQFKHTKIGRMCTNTLCKVMEKIRFAPQGTYETAKILSETGDALAAGGRLGLFTPMYMFVARKPSSKKA
jgi:sterol 24-C-methyltransferase